MSLRDQQYASLRLTKQFLLDLFTVDKYPKTKKEMRRRASACLHHFPYLYGSGEPMWSSDTLTDHIDVDYVRPRRKERHE